MALTNDKTNIAFLTYAIALFLSLLTGTVNAQIQYTFDTPDELTQFSLLTPSGVSISGGQLILEDNTEAGAQNTGLLSQASYKGDLEVIVDYADLSQFNPTGYQPRVQLRLTSADFDQSGLTSQNLSLDHLTHVTLEHATHATIDHNWLKQFDGNAQRADDAFSGRKTSGKLRLVRKAGKVSSYILGHDNQWLQVNAAQPDAFTLEGDARINLFIHAYYNTTYRYVFNSITVWHDTDGDGLLDQEEALLGTNPGVADSDEDGRTDRDDLRPLDNTHAQHLPLDSYFPNNALDVSVHHTLNNQLLLVVKNSTSEAQTLSANLPGLVAGSTIQLPFEQGDLSSATDGFRDTLPAYSRRVYQLDYNLAPLFDPADFSEIVRPLAAGAWTLSLDGLAVDLEDSTALSWTVSGITGSSLNAVINGDDLHITPAQAACGVSIIHLQVSDAQGNITHIDLPIRLTGDSGSELLNNGGMEQFDANPTQIPGWTAHRWSGDIEVTHTDLAAFSGDRSTLIQGYGESKMAIYQHLNLAAGTYRLRAKIASSQLQPIHSWQSTLLYLSFGNRATISHQLIAGDNDWRELELIFNVPQADTGTLYFFNYIPGAFFVDDVSLTTVEACANPAESFTLSDTPLKPLQYDPPVTFAETLLYGYCDDSQFSQTPVCQRLHDVDIAALQPHHAAAPLLLADFESPASTPFASGNWRYTSDALNGQQSALLPPDTYMDGWNANGIPSDWGGYDWLRVDVHNPSDQAQNLYLEIRDTQSVDYWTRVNWYSVAPPGLSTIHVPLQIFVGEKSVIRERRRLDLHNITRLVLASYGANAELHIDDIRLEPEPAYSHNFPELIKLDAGSLTSPLFHDFTPLYPSTTYRSNRGYGFSTDVQIKRTEDRRHPENLLRDWISIDQGGLDIDLPNGEYHVWMMLEDPGYWEYYPNYTRRSVSAEGQTVLNETPTVEDFWARYYRHENTEDLPGDDIWQRYIPGRYQPLRFDVTVNDGQLNLRFNGDGNPYALALSALVIYPNAQATQGEAFLDELWQQLKQQFGYEYKQVDPPLPQHARPAANALDGQLSVFHRSPAVDVYANDWPAADELTADLQIGLAQGEYEPLTISLYPEVDLQLTNATLALPGLTVTPSKVRHKLSRATMDGAVSMNVPRLLDPLAEALPLDLPAHQARRLWFDIHAPQGMPDGTVQGDLTLHFAGGATHVIPVRIEVRPYTLPTADVPLGYLGLAPLYTGSVFPEVAAKQHAEMQASIRLMHDYGMTGFSGGVGGPKFQGYNNGDVVMDFSQADKTMQALQGYGVNEIGTYGDLGIIGLSTYAAPDTTSQYGKAYPEVLADILDAIATHGTANSWPASLLHIVGDEPAGANIQHSLAAAQAFQQADPHSRTGIFSSLTDPLNDTRAAFAGVIDRIYLTHHNRAGMQHIIDQGSECATYNLRNRYHRGVYQYKLSREFGCKGHMQFMWSSVHVDPWYDLDGRESEQADVFTHSDGRLRHTLELERYREAVDDYRYLQLLEASIAAAPDSAVKTAADSWLQTTLGAMTIGHDQPHAWTAEALDQLRREAAQHITLLQTDTDGDGIPDATDPDDDNDGMPDSWEVLHGLDPLDASDALADADHDGLNNLEEFQHGTHPQKPDTDGDGMNDKDELDAGRDPLSADHPPVNHALPVIIKLLLD